MLPLPRPRRLPPAALALILACAATVPAVAADFVAVENDFPTLANMKMLETLEI